MRDGQTEINQNFEIYYKFYYLTGISWVKMVLKGSKIPKNHIFILEKKQNVDIKIHP